MNGLVWPGAVVSSARRLRDGAIIFRNDDRGD